MELHIWLNCCTFTITINSITIPNAISITCVNIISLFKYHK